MPRNPNKKYCQTPGCHSWAMRHRNHCRSHLDHQLGPRAVGAPKNNFNALKSGRYANPWSREQLKQIAYQIAQDPRSLPQQINQVLQSIHQRSENPFGTLALFGHFLQQLSPYVADHTFADQLDAYLETLPPPNRPGIRAKIWKHALPLSAMNRFVLLEEVRKKFPKEKFQP